MKIEWPLQENQCPVGDLLPGEVFVLGRSPYLVLDRGGLLAPISSQYSGTKLVANLESGLVCTVAGYAEIEKADCKVIFKP
jgi:hypothetical protein